MSSLEPPPLKPMIVHRSLLPYIRQGSVFVLGAEELVVADTPLLDGEYWRFLARRNERPTQ